jgi:hypothetical protein
MHTDGMDIDEAIREFEQVVGAMFSIHRRNIEVVKSKIKSRVRDHDSRAALQRALVIAVAAELRRECEHEKIQMIEVA